MSTHPARPVPGSAFRSDAEATKTEPVPWSAAERVQLRALWQDPGKSQVEISREMDRTIAACKYQAAVIGAQRPQGAKKDPKPPYVPTTGRVEAEAQAERIRAYWHARGRVVQVNVVHIPGRAGRGDSLWSPRIAEPVSCVPGRRL